MKIRPIVAFKLLLAFVVLCIVPIARADAKKPNIIFILTDDLGYGDIGAFF